MNTAAEDQPSVPDETTASRPSRRQVLTGAGTAGLLATVPVLRSIQPAAASTSPSNDGTPEQIHLTFGANPATSMTVSWASPGQAPGARVLLTGPGRAQSELPAVQRTYTDGLNGQTVWTYHAELNRLAPNTEYTYVVTADNDGAASPFQSTFRTAPAGRMPFRFTSFGDLATPVTAWVLSYEQSAHAVAAVETFSPLFHLLNGDLCYADLNPTVQPAVWRDFNNNNQASAANRAWMPCLGN
ncbi:MAG: fibronectin type III domain-containing protein, partial [Actinobacteria bacterium]|nr:fibronectin type III domain-containing protein [Actinomycetota bacterium]